MTKTVGQAQMTITTTDQEMSDSLSVEFPNLCEKDGNAHISVNMGYALPFSRGKAAVTITVRCDQNEAMMDRAADMALAKADELAAVGVRLAYQRLQELEAEGLMAQ
jgi:hypothetical protein